MPTAKQLPGSAELITKSQFDSIVRAVIAGLEDVRQTMVEPLTKLLETGIPITDEQADTTTYLVVTTGAQMELQPLGLLNGVLMSIYDHLVDDVTKPVDGKLPVPIVGREMTDANDPTGLRVLSFVPMSINHASA